METNTMIFLPKKIERKNSNINSDETSLNRLNRANRSINSVNRMILEQLDYNQSTLASLTKVTSTVIKKHANTHKNCGGIGYY